MRCIAYSLLTLGLFFSTSTPSKAADEKKTPPPSKIGFRQLVAFKPAAVQQGANTEISYAGGTVILVGVLTTSLSADDFLF